MSFCGLMDGIIQLGFPRASEKERLHGWNRKRFLIMILNRKCQKNALEFVPVLKHCAHAKDLCKGSKVHARILKSGLHEKNTSLASSLISMYGKCGVLENAERLLQELPVKDVVCWNALIAGYAQQGQAQEALNCLERMKKDGIFPNTVTFICLLKACGNAGSMDKGKLIHEGIIVRGLFNKDIVLGSALVDMYVKCGFLEKAEEVLKGLPIRNVVCWNALMTGYAQHGRCQAVWNCFQLLLNDGLSPDAVTFICVLKSCSSMRGALEKGRHIHNKIINMGLLQKHVMLGNALVDMYAKSGAFGRAQQVLHDLPMKNVVSWNALITGYVQHGQYHEAFNCLEWMQREGYSLDVVTYICTLKACGIIGAINKSKKIHIEIARTGFLEKDIVLGNALIDVYAKHGLLMLAKHVMEELPGRDVISWNTLIAGHVQHEQGHEALDCFQMMRIEGLCPDAVTYICVLKACSNEIAIGKGKQIHKEITKKGILDEDISLGNMLVDMYAKCGSLQSALEMLNRLPTRNVVSWSALISGYVQYGQDHQALNCYQQMRSEGLSPDEVTLICILKICGNIGALGKGRRIHEMVVNDGLLTKNNVIGTVLVDMYAKCGMLTKAHHVLEELPVRNVVSWSALIAGYVRQGQDHEALECFEKMRNEGHSPSIVTLISVLRACGSTGSIEEGEKIHNEIEIRGFLKRDIVLGDSLVEMYAQCGGLAKAQEVLEEIPVRNIVSWNALIAGYIKQGQDHEALSCFEWMQSKGLCPNVFTFICILKACGRTGAIYKGKQIHDELVSRGLLGKHIVFGNALVDMYAKCGALTRALQLLKELTMRNTVTWNALIAGYAQQGQGLEALNCFKQMHREGLCPDEISFLCVLNACTRSGLLDEAQMIFSSMTKTYGITPNVKHCTCMVILFGNSGQFDEVMLVIKMMTSSEHPTIWVALLAACAKWGNVKLGALAFDQVLQLDDSFTAAYVFMSSLFLAAGMLEDAEKVEAMSVKHAARKQKKMLDGMKQATVNTVYH